MADMTDRMVSLFVGAILAAALIPVALQQLASGNLTGLDPAVAALYGVIAIAIIVAVVVVFFKVIQK